jgi:hypothetical protein
MANDFLASWREDAVVDPDSTGLAHRAPRGEDKSGDKGPGLDARHRTVGVSMSPGLRAVAAARARALGLPFSRYVAWCVEAELEGRPPQARFARRAGRGKVKSER